MVIVIGLVFTGIISLQAIPLVKRKMWRELASVSFLMAVALIYTYDWILEWHLPSIKILMEITFIPISVFLEKLLTP